MVAFVADALDVVLNGVVWELFVAFAVTILPFPADMEPFPLLPFLFFVLV